MQQIMDQLRNDPPKTIGGLPVTNIADYEQSISTCVETGAVTNLTLPKSNVLAFTLTDGASVVIRPSGTEPKIKAYYTTTGKDRASAAALEAKLQEDFSGLLQ